MSPFASHSCILCERNVAASLMGLRFFFILFLVIPFLSVDASSQSHRTVIYFPVRSARLDTAAFHNGLALDSLRLAGEALLSDPAVRVTDIHFEGYASPEGPEALNRRLSLDRRRALEDYVRARFPWPDSLFSASIVIYHEVPASDYAKATLAERLRMISGFGPLRCASVEIKYRQRAVPLPGIPDVLLPKPLLPEALDPLIDVGDSLRLNVILNPEPPCRTLYMALKTNLLYDALLVPTLGAEAYVGRNLSISAQWSYAWWSRNGSQFYWRFYGGDLGLRWWFGKEAGEKPLTGHHVGLYGQILTYDFETGGRGQMGAKFNYGGGLEYGFSLPIARRLNIDFTVGVGYVGGRYYDYRPIDGHYVWTATRNRRWFGPTKAEVSLVRLIGCGNYNEKGGRR